MWSQPRLRGLLWQALLLVLLISILVVIGVNLNANMASRGVTFGFDFLFTPAGFDISEHVIPYSADRPYWQALLVGLMNTFKVSFLGILMATSLGLFLAMGSLSVNPLMAWLSKGYVELIRNVPLLLQLFFWYLLLTTMLPDPQTPLSLLPGLFLSKNGLQFPWFSGENFPALSIPEMGFFGLTGGGSLSPEFLALLFGLGIYTSAFIAEVIRAGILSVARGQTEAATALGLTRWQQLRWVILPQALRLIIPPMTNQFLNLTKNSSLAVAIGYPELVSVSTTTLNQTGRAVEAILILMMVYLTLSLLTSLVMHRFEAATREKGF